MTHTLKNTNSLNMYFIHPYIIVVILLTLKQGIFLNSTISTINTFSKVDLFLKMSPAGLVMLELCIMVPH